MRGIPPPLIGQGRLELIGQGRLESRRPTLLRLLAFGNSSNVAWPHWCPACPVMGPHADRPPLRAFSGTMYG